MVEATLIVDSYGRNHMYTGDTAMVHQIYHLIVMDPGTDHLNPEKGVGIKSYRYSYTDQTVLSTLENNILMQINKYTPYTLLNVMCKSIKNRKGDYYLHVFISLNEINEVINISTDGEKTELAVIKV